MKAGLLKLAMIVVGLNLFFVYLGLYVLPQSESRPRKVTKIQEGISREELIQVGEKIVFGKGECMVCHPMQPEAGMRAPAIARIGLEMEREAKERGIPSDEHVFEALVNPSKYIAKGFEDIMPPSHKPSTSLTDGELIAVAAYLQSKGGKVTVSYSSIGALSNYLRVLEREIEKPASK